MLAHASPSFSVPKAEVSSEPTPLTCLNPQTTLDELTQNSSSIHILHALYFLHLLRINSFRPPNWWVFLIILSFASDLFVPLVQEPSRYIPVPLHDLHFHVNVLWIHSKDRTELNHIYFCAPAVYLTSPFYSLCQVGTNKRICTFLTQCVRLRSKFAEWHQNIQQ